VDQKITEIYNCISAADESHEFRASYFTSKIIKESIKYLLFNEMKNSPTLEKIMGEIIIMKKLQELLIQIVLKL
jgi:hypothetical protein